MITEFSIEKIKEGKEQKPPNKHSLNPILYYHLKVDEAKPEAKFALKQRYAARKLFENLQAPLDVTSSKKRDKNSCIDEYKPWNRHQRESRPRNELSRSVNLGFLKKDCLHTDLKPIYL